MVKGYTSSYPNGVQRYRDIRPLKAGAVFEIEGSPCLDSQKGFPFSRDPLQVFGPIPFPFRLWEVDAEGQIDGEDRHESRTDRLVVLREVPEEEAKKLLSGRRLCYHSNGKLSLEEEYFEGKRLGLFRAFDIDGNMKIEGTCHEGQTEGLVTVFHSEPGVRSEASYKNGKLDGLCNWFRGNRPIRTALYENGILQGDVQQHFGEDSAKKEE